VAAGADPRDAYYDSLPVIHVVACAGAATLAWVLEAGGDAQMRADYTEQTPLMAVGGADAAANVAALLDAGAELEAVDRHGQTALMWAVMNAEPVAVAALLEAGANPRRRCSTHVSHVFCEQATMPGARADEMVDRYAIRRGIFRSHSEVVAFKWAIRALLAAALAGGDHEAKRAADVCRRAWHRRAVAVSVWAVIRVGEWA